MERPPHSGRSHMRDSPSFASRPSVSMHTCMHVCLPICVQAHILISLSPLVYLSDISDIEYPTDMFTQHLFTAFYSLWGKSSGMDKM